MRQRSSVTGMAPTDSPLTISQVLHDGMCIIEIAGRLDSHTSPDAQAKFIEATKHHQRILLDCSHTTFMSSAGLRAIILAHRAARDAGGKLAVCIASSAVMETVQVSAIDQVIPIAPTLQQAMAELR
ncbi:MAG: anti-sigma factor antagonist [Phycisphaerales bacterium]|nr:anti-sigma factor antagonist [Phycisphaerales bacterium]